MKTIIIEVQSASDPLAESVAKATPANPVTFYGTIDRQQRELATADPMNQAAVNGMASQFVRDLRASYKAAEAACESGTDGAHPAMLPEVTAAYQQHLLRLADYRRLGMTAARDRAFVSGVKSAMADPPAIVAAKPDGPFGISGFRWKGIEYTGLTPRAMKLIDLAWAGTDRTCAYDEAFTAVHGDDIGPDKPLHDARRDANKFFRDENIPLTVRVSGDRRVGRVEVVAAAK